MGSPGEDGFTMQKSAQTTKLKINTVGLDDQERRASMEYGQQEDTASIVRNFCQTFI